MQGYASKKLSLGDQEILRLQAGPKEILATLIVIFILCQEPTPPGSSCTSQSHLILLLALQIIDLLSRKLSSIWLAIPKRDRRTGWREGVGWRRTQGSEEI